MWRAPAEYWDLSKDASLSWLHSWLHKFSTHFPSAKWLSIFCKNTKTKCELFSKLARKTSKQCRWCCSNVFTTNFEYISHLDLVFLLLLWLLSINKPNKKEKRFKRNCGRFIFGLKNVNCFCRFLIAFGMKGCLFNRSHWEQNCSNRY